jgi:hypothetical protein
MITKKKFNKTKIQEIYQQHDSFNNLLGLVWYLY